MFSLQQTSIDPETGRLDSDVWEVGALTASKRNVVHCVREVMEQLTEEHGRGNSFPIDELVNICIEKGYKEHQVDDAVERLKQAGDLMEPRSGFVLRL